MHSSLEAYQALIQKNNKKNGRTLTRSLLTKRIELYQDCNKKQLTFTISTPVMLKISKHFHTEWCRNSLFWSLVTFPNWGKVTGNPASVILENKKKKTTLLVSLLAISEHVLWICSKICFSAQKKPKRSDSQSELQDEPPILQHPQAFSWCWGPILRVLEAITRSSAVPSSLPELVGNCHPAAWGGKSYGQQARTDWSTAPPSSQNKPWSSL